LCKLRVALKKPLLIHFNIIELKFIFHITLLYVNISVQSNLLSHTLILIIKMADTNKLNSTLTDLDKALSDFQSTMKSF
jgi:hypothetical protein